MSAALQIELRPLTREHAPAFCQLVIALAEFEKLPPPDEVAQTRLIEDALGAKPRIEVWLAFVNEDAAPCGYMILVETYSSFLALPTLYLEDLFVLPERRGHGVGKEFVGVGGPRVVQAADREVDLEAALVGALGGPAHPG